VLSFSLDAGQEFALPLGYCRVFDIISPDRSGVSGVWSRHCFTITMQLIPSCCKTLLLSIEKWIRSSLPKIISKCCALVKVCHINHRGPVFIFACRLDRAKLIISYGTAGLCMCVRQTFVKCLCGFTRFSRNLIHMISVPIHKNWWKKFTFKTWIILKFNILKLKKILQFNEKKLPGHQASLVLTHSVVTSKNYWGV